MSNNQKYWKGAEELQRSPEFLKTQKHEFADALPLDEVLSDVLIGQLKVRLNALGEELVSLKGITIDGFVLHNAPFAKWSFGAG